LTTDGVAFRERHFVFVGRFVAKKNLFVLLDAYAAYLGVVGSAARRLILIGDGPDGPLIRQRIDELGIGEMVDLPGFQSSRGVGRALSKALALVLVSSEEQWGLVVNEALAFGLPIIASQHVGACDTLVRNLINGFVVESHSVEAIALAMQRMSADEANWNRMASESSGRAWLGDSGRFADAIDLILHPDAHHVTESVRRFHQAVVSA
jgi:glycosyltransferase involved in cell wall biosynthesis